MRRTFALLFMALSIFAGCAEEPPPPPPEQQAPPEPTKEQISGELTAAAGPIFGSQATGLPFGVRDPAIAAVKSVVDKYRMKENGKAAVADFNVKVTEFIRQSRDAKPHKAGVEMGGVMLHEAINPGDSRYAKRKEYLQVLLDRPVVEVQGFLETDDALTVFLQVTDPKSKESKKYQLQEGEEFHGTLRLVRIVGNQQAVEVEYLPIKEIFEIKGPRTRDE